MGFRRTLSSRRVSGSSLQYADAFIDRVTVGGVPKALAWFVKAQLPRKRKRKAGVKKR